MDPLSAGITTFGSLAAGLFGNLAAAKREKKKQAVDAEQQLGQNLLNIEQMQQQKRQQGYQDIINSLSRGLIR